MRQLMYKVNGQVVSTMKEAEAISKHYETFLIPFDLRSDKEKAEHEKYILIHRRKIAKKYGIRG